MSRRVSDVITDEVTAGRIVRDDPFATARQRLLLLTHRVPYPPDRGDRIRSYHLMKLLARHFDLAVACMSDEPVSQQQRRVLHSMARRVAIAPISRRYSRIRGMTAMLGGEPATPAAFFRPRLGRVIRQWHRCEPFDAVLSFCTGMIKYARLVVRADTAGPVRHVLDLVDVDSAKWQSYAEQTAPPMRWVYAAESRRLRDVEAGRYDQFDALTVVSRAEAVLYRQQVGDHPNLHVVSNGVDMDYFHPLADADTKRLVFVGVLDYRPNVEAVTWFVEQVMPLIRQRVNDVTLSIVGRHPTRQVFDLGRHEGVQVVGPVDDVRVYLEQAGVVVAPLRLARGIQNKVLEAMASSRAVVCSPAAFEGIEAIVGRDLCVADQPRQWAATLERLLSDPLCRKSIARAGRRQAERVYHWTKCLEPMVELLGGRQTAPLRAAG